MPSTRRQPPSITEALTFIRSELARLSIIESPETSSLHARLENALSSMPIPSALESLHSLWQSLAMLDYMCRIVIPNAKLKGDFQNTLSGILHHADTFFKGRT